MGAEAADKMGRSVKFACSAHFLNIFLSWCLQPHRGGTLAGLAGPYAWQEAVAMGFDLD